MYAPIGIGLLVPVEWELVDAVVDFYAEVVGFPIADRGTSEAGNPWCTFQSPTTTLTIHTGRDGNFPYPEFRPTGHGIALALEVEELETTIDRLERHEVQILNRWSHCDDEAAVSIADPAGNRIEFWGHVEPSEIAD